MKDILYVILFSLIINPVYALVINNEDPVYYFVNQEKVINNIKNKLKKK